MKKIIGGILGLLIAAIAIIHFSLPDTFTVEREITINKPASTVYDELRHLKRHIVWDPWSKKDPNMKSEHIGEDGTVGFIGTWAGNQDVGSGEQEITNLVENEKIETALRFKEPFENSAVAIFSITPESETSSKVTWTMVGESKFPFSVICFFMNMEKVLAAEFDSGLSSMKAHIESL